MVNTSMLIGDGVKEHQVIVIRCHHYCMFCTNSLKKVPDTDMVTYTSIQGADHYTLPPLRMGELHIIQLLTQKLNVICL